ncbi:PTS sugar transporter subunit IIB [Fusibacter sp. JL298sf-3]
MRRIMLVCSAGMSTSMLVTKMKKAATEQSIDAEIFACSEAEAKEKYGEVDVILLGPQVRFLLSNIKKAVESRNIPVAVIDSIEYGTMNGAAVLTKAMAM